MDQLPPRVRRHGTGYRCVVSLNGVRHYGQTFATPDLAAAEAERILGVAAATGAAPRILTLQAACDLLLDDLKTARADTRNYYGKYLRRFVERWGAETPLHRIDEATVRAYIEERLRQVSPQTAWLKELQIIGRLFKMALARNMLARDATAGIKPPKIRRPRFHALSRDEVLAIVDRILISEFPRSRFHADIVLFLFWTGLRLAEAARLRVGDYRAEPEGATLWVDGKTDHRHQPVPAALRPVIDRLRAGKASTEPLIGTRRVIARALELWKQRLNLPAFSPHVLRHSYATALVRLGTRPHDLQLLLGHHDLKMGARYYHAAGTDLQAAVDALGAHRPARAPVPAPPASAPDLRAVGPVPPPARPRGRSPRSRRGSGERTGHGQPAGEGAVPADR